jgi:hypothetical protein
MVLGLLGSATVFVAADSETPGTATETSPQITVDEIVNRTNYVAYYQGTSGRANVSMVIRDSQGREQQREFTILRKNVLPQKEAEKAGPSRHTGDQKFYVYFHRPADVRRMVFMVWKNVGKDDDRWMYYPAYDLVKRIAASDKRTSFVGSDFLYEDVSGRSIEEDAHELARTTETYYVLKNTPKKPDGVEFSSFTMWIHKTTFVPVKIEYFDKQGELYRVYQALKVETVQGYPTVVKSSMKDDRTKSETVIEYSDVKYEMDLPDEIFTERYLRRPPTEYLK